MSKYIKLKDLIDTDCILLGEIECDDCPFYDKERTWCRLIEWINSLPTIEVSEEVEDESCKGCKHYKLACDMFSEICKYEPRTQIETENLNRNLNDISVVDSEDCISREYILSFLDGEIWGDDDYIAGMKDEQREIREVVKNAPSVVPLGANMKG